MKYLLIFLICVGIFNFANLIARILWKEPIAYKYIPWIALGMWALLLQLQDKMQ